jgi:putative endonuclease
MRGRRLCHTPPAQPDGRGRSPAPGQTTPRVAPPSEPSQGRRSVGAVSAFRRPPQPIERGAGSGAGARADRRRALARSGERLAACHLQGLGFSVLARNVRTRHGEIDLIAFDGQTLVFAEVKTRTVHEGSAVAGPLQLPLEALTARQRARLRRLAGAWLAQDRPRPSAHTIRFDAIGVSVDAAGVVLRIEHLPDAW